MNPESFPEEYRQEPPKEEREDMRVVMKKAMPESLSFLEKNDGKRKKIESNNQSEEKGLEEQKIEILSDEESGIIFDIAKIHGEEFDGKLLTKEVLKEAGLMPKYKIDMDGFMVWFSSHGFRIDDNRIAVIAYVRKGNEIVTRSYYRSNSQGVWKYLPSCIVSDGKIDLYMKGYGEESVTLPIYAQKALSIMTEDESTVLDIGENAEIILAGTTRNIASRSTYEGEMESKPEQIDVNFYKDKDQVPPEEMILPDEKSPDFSEKITGWKTKNDKYGIIYIDVFASKDKKWRFMFSNDSLGRAWIAGIENDSEILSTGLRTSWVNAGNLTTPAYEYTSQAGMYGDRKLINGNYIDVYNKYLSKIPVIKEYKEWLAEHRKKR